MALAPESSRISDTSQPSNEELGGGRYAVVGTLGSGSQGETLSAVDKREGRPVAIKRFTIRGAKSWKDVELAEREATVLASLSHPNLPRYIEHFEENGTLCLVMEKVEGENLAARRKRGQALTPEQVIRLLKDTAECLRYLHGHAPPIVHRDIKPGNVILRPDGSYCLVDFGSVRDRLKPEGGSTVVGTFGFMAPEQFQGRAAPGSDVYAVGATALSLITGREPEDLPHKGLGIDVEAALRGQVDRRLIAALRSMLEPDPDRRATSVDAALRSSGLLDDAGRGNADPRSAEALKQARRARLEAEKRHQPFDDIEERFRHKVDEKVRKTVEKQLHKAEQRRRKAIRHAERRARQHYHDHDWRRPGRPVPPGRVLGFVILIALRIAGVATFALFGVLLPLLFNLLGNARRRERMRQINTAGQRGLSRAREHIRYQFLGGAVPAELVEFMEAGEADAPARTRVDSRQRVSIDVEAEERELEEQEAATAPRTETERTRR